MFIRWHVCCLSFVCIVSSLLASITQDHYRMASPLSLLAALIVALIALAAVTTAHYTKISNSCAKIQISGTISEAMWRESRPIRVGTVNTESDTTAHVKTNFG